jgi:tetratricopeptide (TPR) repeat protein
MIETPSTQDAAGGLLQAGIAAAGEGRAEDAIARFREAVALRADLVPAQANLGLLLVASGRAAEAEPPLRVACARLPHDPVLRNALGVALEALQRPAEAEAAFRAALLAAPGMAEAHANLGHCLRRLGRLHEAAAHYAQAAALAPAFAAAHCGLGHVHQDEGRLEEAVACYRAALAAEPGLVEALNNLGVCLRQLGAIEEAAAAFERVLALRPDQIEAHCNLSPLKKYRPGDPQVERLLGLAHRVPALPEHGRVRYWFAAGKMLDDVGRHDEAFDAFAEGNRLKRAQTPWDEATHEDLVRRIRATLTRETLARLAPAPDAEADGPIPVFIVGMPRSGTSLLEQVLATHPAVHGAGELTWLGEALASAAGDLPPGAAFAFPETLAGWRPEALRRLGRRYRERLRALAPGASHVVDKLPGNFLHVGFMHLLFPDARIVHAQRDPMDACFSCWSRLFAADHLAFTYDLEALGRYWVTYDELMRHWRAALPPGRMLEMPYETMVADFEAQARRLVDYLGLPWDARCLDFHDNRRLVRTASVAQVRRPIYRSSVARWRAYERRLAPLAAIVGGRYPPR